MSEKRKFKIGDRVRWTSQAAGVTKKKEGQIVCVVPPFKSPKDYGFKSKDGFGSGTRHAESYVVLVESAKKPKKAHYWPHAKLLEMALETKTTGIRVTVPEVESPAEEPKKKETPPLPTPSSTFVF